MKNYAKFTAIILMTALLMAGCSNQTAQDGGNIQAGGNSAVNENVGNIGGDSDGTLSQEEQAAMEAELAAKEENVLFGGRLGQYRYYDMDKVIEAALQMVEQENK